MIPFSQFQKSAAVDNTETWRAVRFKNDQSRNDKKPADTGVTKKQSTLANPGGAAATQATTEIKKDGGGGGSSKRELSILFSCVAGWQEKPFYWLLVAIPKHRGVERRCAICLRQARKSK